MQIVIPKNLVRFTILDISGTYSQIYDEYWIPYSEFDSECRKYNSKLFMCLITS